MEQQLPAPPTLCEQPTPPHDPHAVGQHALPLGDSTPSIPLLHTAAGPVTATGANQTEPPDTKPVSDNQSWDHKKIEKKKQGGHSTVSTLKSRVFLEVGKKIYTASKDVL